MYDSGFELGEAYRNDCQDPGRCVRQAVLAPPLHEAPPPAEADVTRGSCLKVRKERRPRGLDTRRRKPDITDSQQSDPLAPGTWRLRQ